MSRVDDRLRDAQREGEKSCDFRMLKDRLAERRVGEDNLAVLLNKAGSRYGTRHSAQSCEEILVRAFLFFLFLFDSIVVVVRSLSKRHDPFVSA